MERLSAVEGGDHKADLEYMDLKGKAEMVESEEKIRYFSHPGASDSCFTTYLYPFFKKKEKV